MPTAAERVAEQYPFFQFLLGDPEVGPLLTRAVDPATQFSPQKFQAELMNTSWFRNREAASREWEILINSDPAEAQRRRHQYAGGLMQIGVQLGLPFNMDEINYMTEYGLSHGIASDDPAAKVALRGYLQQQSPFRFEAGAVGAGARDVQWTGSKDYFIDVPGEVAWNWGIDLALGYKDRSQLGQYMVGYAASRYPWLYDELVNKGQTMRSLFSGHMQTLAEEWEMNPEQVDWKNPTMQKIIGRQVLDTGTLQGGVRPASLYEAKIFARQDNRFWQTSKAQEMQSSLSNYLLKSFGKVA